MTLARSLFACLPLALGACATKTSVAPTHPPTAATRATVSDEFRFPLSLPQVGDQVTEFHERTMVATVESSPTQRVHLLSSEQRTELKQVVAIDGDIVTKRKVTHRSVTNQATVNGQARAELTPTMGKTYLVWRDDRGIQVSYLDGSAPSAAEIKEVRRGNRSIGRQDPLERIVAERGWKVGERFEFTPAQLAEMNQASDDDEPSLTAMTLTLQTVDAATATMAMTMTMTADGGAMTIDLAGTVKVDRKTNRPLEFSGTGPFSGGTTLKMVGTMTMKTRYAY